jgi:hypothetical protein
MDRVLQSKTEALDVTKENNQSGMDLNMLDNCKSSVVSVVLYTPVNTERYHMMSLARHIDHKEDSLINRRLPK